MTDRPILFSGPMVRAILEGRKTQTRRVVRAPTEDLNHPAVHHWQMDQEHRAVAVAHSEKVADQYITTFPHYRILCPYGVPGDRLWVRETWAMLSGDNRVWYRADPGVEDCVARSLIGWPGWQPSIFMPRENSRITLEVTAVRIEQLQEISVADALSEGVDELPKSVGPGIDERTSYIALWDSINAKRAPWSSNPWVWVIEFRRAA